MEFFLGTKETVLDPTCLGPNRRTATEVCSKEEFSSGQAERQDRGWRRTVGVDMCKRRHMADPQTDSTSAHSSSAEAWAQKAAGAWAVVHGTEHGQTRT